jgi:prepilin-type processing-associated H-X9-DG protein
VHDGTAISKSLAEIAIVLASGGGMMLAMGRELLAKRHVGGAVISFADGHVKWTRLPEEERWEVANERK